MLDLIVGVLVSMLVAFLYGIGVVGILPINIMAGIAGLSIVLYGLFVRFWTMKMVVRNV